MTSRERVLKTLRHEEPDKVPIDLGAMRSTGIMAMAYNQLKKYLGMKGGVIKIYDVYQQLAEPEPEILDRFEVDVIDLNNTLGKLTKEWKDWPLPDGTTGQIHVSKYPVKQGYEWVLMEKGRPVARMPQSCYYFETIYHPLAEAKSSAEIKNYNWPFFRDEELREVEKQAKFLFEETDYAIMGGFGGNILEYGQELRGWSKFMMDLAVEKNFAADLMDKMVEVHLRNLEGYLQAVGNFIQIIQMGDDLGTQNAAQMSPKMYREMIKPRHKKVYQYVKEHSGLYLFLHTCGSVYDLIPDLIDAGVEILNPVQTSAAKMDPAALKAEFGDRLTFWGGGTDTQHILPDGSPEQVRENVKEMFKIFAPGGGFVFTQVHNVQANVPPENVVAAYETAKKYRNYPVK